MNSKPVWKIEKIVLPQHADHAGVMWHGKYFNWLEESRINALSEVGISYFELTKNGLDLPLINTSIKYKSPLFLGEKITIESEFNIDKSPRINVISKFHNKKNEEDFSMGRISKLEKYVKGTKIKSQEGLLIPISGLYSLCFSKSVLLGNSFVTRSLFFNKI